MKILVSAAETSSDAHGAELLRALKLLLPPNEALTAFGVGGPKLKAAGLDIRFEASELLAMGFGEILSRLPRILSILSELSAQAKRERPDLAIVIDYPDFHFKLARNLKRLGIPVIYFIPPKVWAWRQGRVNILRERFAKILTILPFEAAFYRGHSVPVSYVGSPLLDQLPLNLTRKAARLQLGLTPEAQVLLLMPGSRPSELIWHLDLMLDASFMAAKDLRTSGVLPLGHTLKVLLPFAVTTDLSEQKARVDRWLSLHKNPDQCKALLELRVSQGDAHLAMKASDVGLVKSGTSTLEAAMLGLPHAVVYQANFATRWIFKNLIRYKNPIGLSNLILRDQDGHPIRIVREILGTDATPQSLAAEVVRLWVEQSSRTQILNQFEALLQEMKGGLSGGPSRNAALEVLQVYGRKND